MEQKPAQAPEQPQGQQDQGQDQGQDQDQGQTQGQPAAQGGVQLPPNVKGIFQRLLVAAQRLIYSDSKTAQGLVQMVAKAKDPAQGIAQAVGAIVSRIAEQVKGVPPEVVHRISVPVAYMIAELALQAGVIEDTPEFQKAMVSAVIGQGGEPAQDTQEGAQQGAAAEPAEGEGAPPQGAGIVNGAMAEG